MVLLLLSSLLIGISTPLASYLVKDQDALAFAFQFLLMSVLIQIPLVLSKSQEFIKVLKTREFLQLMITGLIGALLYWCEFSALKVGLPVAHISFLSLTVPAWVMLYEKKMGIPWIMAMLGSLVIILPEGEREFAQGHLLPFLTSMFFAAYIVSSKKSQEAQISPVICSFVNDFFSLLGIVVIILCQGETAEMWNAPPSVFNLFVFAGVIVLLPGLIFLYGLKDTELELASHVVILEPVILGIIAVAMDSSVLGLNFVLGAVMISLSSMPMHKIRVLYTALNIFK